MPRAKRIMTIVVMLLIILSVVGRGWAKGFLHTKGEDIVDENGNKILLAGGAWELAAA